jgi:hypothetical protein
MVSSDELPMVSRDSEGVDGVLHVGRSSNVSTAWPIASCNGVGTRLEKAGVSVIFGRGRPH